tara:strand:+ start:26 stop:442 length:417 start_codon:yes stop_codon:yes gene_type:complete
MAGPVMNNIFIAISIVLNGVLLSFLFGLVPFLLYLSVVTNVLFLWYIYRSLQNVGDIEEDLLEVLKSIEGLSDDIDDLHSMEMFYGEPVLQGLINNSRSTMNDIIDVLEKYYDVRAEQIDEDEDEDNQEEETEEPILY